MSPRMADRTRDGLVRLAAFAWLEAQVDRVGDIVLSRATLAQGFEFEGVRVPLVGPQGIFKPRVLESAPLSITTAPDGPYDDSFGPGGLLRYRYRGTDPGHADNRGLRLAMRERLPLAYFIGIVPGKYLATWPAYVVGDDPAQLAFTVAIDDAAHAALSAAGHDPMVHEEAGSGRRRYVTAVVRKRLHQRAFRERVLDAYRRQCAFCRLRHDELLDAAHIDSDSAPEGAPVVSNGLALCKLHHAAFERHLVGVRPDLVLQVRPDIRLEKDGPTLVHSIQALHDVRVVPPRKEALRPSPERLARRFERFLEAKPA